MFKLEDCCCELHFFVRLGVGERGDVHYQGVKEFREVENHSLSCAGEGQGGARGVWKSSRRGRKAS